MFEVKKVKADLDREFFCTGYLVYENGAYCGMGFDREAADSLIPFMEECGDSMVYDAEQDAYVIECEGDVEVDKGEDIDGLNLYFIGCEMDFVWGYDDEQ